MQRKLTAILSADVVAYSSLMERDESGTMERLKVNRNRIFDPQIAIHGGRVFKLIGDGALAEFPSVIAAVECALAIQEATEKAASDATEDSRIRYRMGINLGEVIVEGDDIYGEGVNVAARLQTLASVGGICVSKSVRDNSKGKTVCAFEDMGEVTVKNIETPVHVFSVGAAIVRVQDEAELSKIVRSPKLSICVLPFTNMSGDIEQEYFSDGISEDIITDLSKVSALAVISRNSAFQYKGKHVDLPKVARELKVSHVLEGSVRKAGGRVRITAQLIDGTTNDHIWAERYDRDLNDIFALQDEISEAIVRALKLKLMPEEKKAIEQRGTDNVEAYNLYLLARQQYGAGVFTDSRKSDTVIRLSRGAIKLDPNYARAWALIATAQRMRMYVMGDGDNGLLAATKALELDESLAEAHAARAGVLAARGEYESARAEIEIALRLDPDSVDVNREAARLSFHERRLADAIGHWELVSKLVETDYQSGSLVITCHQALGDAEGLRRVAQRTLARAENAVALEPDNGSAMAAVVSCLVSLGERERAREWARRAVLIDPDNMSMRYNLGCDFVVGLRDVETALGLLGPVFEHMGRERLEWAKGDPDFDTIRDDPRFKAMVAAAETRLAAARDGGSSPPS
jgi:adenylate cyclase